MSKRRIERSRRNTEVRNEKINTMAVVLGARFFSIGSGKNKRWYAIHENSDPHQPWGLMKFSSKAAAARQYLLAYGVDASKV